MIKALTFNIHPLIIIISSLHQLIKTFRVHNTRSMILFYLLGVKLSHKPFNLPDIFLISLSFIFSYAFASILNFTRDHHIDAANRRQTPPALASLNFKELQSLTLGSAILALILTLFTQSPAIYFLGICAHLALGYAYSHPTHPLSFHPLGKSISMAIGYLLLPALLGLGRAINPTQIYSVFWIVLYYASWQLFNDIKDIKGDKKFGKKTLAVILGARKLTAVSLLIGLLSLFFLHRLVLYPYTILPQLLTLNYLILITFQIIAFLRPAFIFQKINRQIAGYLLLTSIILLLFLV